MEEKSLKQRYHDLEVGQAMRYSDSNKMKVLVTCVPNGWIVALSPQGSMAHETAGSATFVPNTIGGVYSVEKG